MNEQGIFIEGFENKYKIFSTGEIVSLYRYNKNKIKVDTFNVLKYHFEPITGQYQCYLSSKIYNVKTLFKKYFNLIPPNNYQKFVLEFKNQKGDFNINNLYFKPLLLKQTNFLPEIIVDKNNIPIKKRCTNCGDFKNIKVFVLQKGEQNKITFRNECNTCRKDNFLFQVKNNPIIKENYLNYAKKRRSLDYVKEYHKTYNKEYIKNFPKNYVAKILKIKVTDLPDSLYHLKKQQLLLTCKLKEL